MVTKFIACPKYNNNIHGLPQQVAVITVYTRLHCILTFWSLWGPWRYQPCMVSISTENIQLEGDSQETVQSWKANNRYCLL